MRNLIVRPGSPWQGFLKGLGGTFMAVGIPLAGIPPIRAGSWDALAISVPFALGVSLLGGLALAVWRLIQGWAYREFVGDDR